MSHVLIVEPDDEFSLSLRHAVCAAAAPVTLTDSVEGARAALSDTGAIDLVIANAHLPDGSGWLIASEAARHGRQTWILRCSIRGSVEIRDADRLLFRGTRQEACDFLTGTITRRCRGRASRPTRPSCVQAREPHATGTAQASPALSAENGAR